MGLGLALKYENESSCYPLHLATEYQGELSLPPLPARVQRTDAGVVEERPGLVVR